MFITNHSNDVGCINRNIRASGVEVAGDGELAALDGLVGNRDLRSDDVLGVPGVLDDQTWQSKSKVDKHTAWFRMP